MTKPTIINNVDVSGCSACKEGKCLITKDKCNARCDYGAYYLFDELKRKEAEYEKWKSYYDLYRQNEKMLKKYKQALKEIREIALSTLNCGEWIGQGDNKIEAILQKCEVVDDE